MTRYILSLVLFLTIGLVVLALIGRDVTWETIAFFAVFVLVGTAFEWYRRRNRATPPALTAPPPDMETR